MCPAASDQSKEIRERGREKESRCPLSQSSRNSKDCFHIVGDIDVHMNLKIVPSYHGLERIHVCRIRRANLIHSLQLPYQVLHFEAQTLSLLTLAVKLQEEIGFLLQPGPFLEAQCPVLLIDFLNSIFRTQYGERAGRTKTKAGSEEFPGTRTSQRTLKRQYNIVKKRRPCKPISSSFIAIVAISCCMECIAIFSFIVIFSFLSFHASSSSLRSNA